MENAFSNAKYISRVTTDIVRSIVNRTGRAIFREMSDDDIGTDGQVELIKLTSKKQMPTGRTAFVQLKGTGSPIKTLKSRPEISVEVNHTTLEYARDKNTVPVILIYSSTTDRDNFYFCDLRKAFGENFETELDRTITKHTAHIPKENNFLENSEEFFKIINNM